MNLRIEKLNLENMGDLKKIDDSFETNSALELKTRDGEITYEIREIPLYKKTYGEIEEQEWRSFINSETGAAFLAYKEDQIAGRISLKKHWNNFAFIDIAVDRLFRRQGIGRQLLSTAIEWARKQNFPGIILETQDINVSACKFYESCGCRIGGFDKFLYKGVNLPREETAVFWYYLF